MLKKEVCQKCYRYHERVWGKDEDEEWEEGRIICPIDNFNTMSHHGRPVKVNDRSLRNLFGAIFGWHETDNGTPKYCRFGDEHENG